MEMQGGSRGQRLVLVPYPGQGHINPMLQLATILYSKGFSITIVHPQFSSPNPSSHPNFTFLDIPDGLLSHDRAALGSFVAMLSAINKNCEAPFQQCMEGMMKEDRITCIIYDALMFFTQTVADRLKLPGISLRASSAASVLAFAASPRLHQGGYIPLQDIISEELDLPGLPELNIGNLTDTLLELRVALTSSMKRSSGIIVNTMDYLEHKTLSKVHEYFPVPIFPIGPLHKFAPSSSGSLLKEDTGCITWLDKQAPNSVIYVSFGSLAGIDEREFVEVARGLASSKQPFLWVVRPGSVRGSEWTELLPTSLEETVGERGCIVKWAPQKEVLAHNAVGGFWSHCGWNSTLESICEGIPMLCRPFVGDQILNARYVSHVWRVGLELEKSESGEIEKAVRRLMVDKEGDEMRQRAMELKEKAELCLKSGGSSCNFLNELVECLLSF